MENAGKKPTAIWRKLIVIIPLTAIWIGWIFGYLHHIFGWVLIAGSAALNLSLIPIIFIRPLSDRKALRVTARCLMFLVLTAVISLQCFAGIVFFWLAD